MPTDRLLARVAEWTARLDRPAVEATFTEGPADRDKRAVWTQLAGPAAHGQLTLWDSGEVEVEAYAPESLRLVLSVSDVVNWTVEFRDRRDGSTWLMDYPRGYLHGGGPPRLRRIPDADRP